LLQEGQGLRPEVEPGLDPELPHLGGCRRPDAVKLPDRQGLDEFRPHFGSDNEEPVRLAMKQRLAQIPGSGGAARLHKMIGITRTKDIVIRLRRVSGRQAADWGIATDCVSDGELEAATGALVDELRAFSSLAQRTAKKLLNDIEDASLSLAIELEGQCYDRLRNSEDFREGVEALVPSASQISVENDTVIGLHRA